MLNFTLGELSIPGRGVPLDLSLSFNGGNAKDAKRIGPMGYGWTHSYQMSMIPDPNYSTGFDLTEENGTQSFLSQVVSAPIPDPQTTWTAIAGGIFSEAALTQNADGSYTLLRERSQIKYQLGSNGSQSNTLLSETDRNGYKTSLTYNNGYLAQVNDPAGRYLTFGYTWSATYGYLVSYVQDSAGRQISLAYNDGNGNLTDITDVNGNVSHFVYDSYHNITAVTDPRGNATKYSYYYSGLGGLVSTVTDGLGRTTTLTYNITAYHPGTRQPPDVTATVWDPKNNVTTVTYNWGMITSLTRGSSTWKYVNDGFGHVTQMTDPNGHVWNYTWTLNTYSNGAPRLVKNLTQSTDPLGRSSSASYNTFNEMLTGSDGLGIATTMIYDGNGNLLSTSRPVYYGTNQIATSALTYGDPSHPGDATSMTDPNGKVWHTQYDTYGNRTKTIDPLGHSSTAGYDGAGRKIWSVDPNGHGANYTYDNAGHLLTVKDALGHQSASTYDGDGNVITSSDRNGNSTQFTYDAANQLTTVTRADGSKLNKSYFADGALQWEQDAAGDVTYYNYDNQGRLSDVTDPLGRKTSFAYDANGNRVAVVDALKQGVAYTFDAANQLTAITYNNSTITPNVSNITYDATGKRTSMTDGTGTSTWSYDGLNRMRTATNGLGRQVVYNYDLAGHPTQVFYPSALNVTYAYDDAGRMTSLNDGIATTTFGYDAAANLTTLTQPNHTTIIGYTADDKILSMAHSGKAAGAYSTFTYTRDNNDQLATRKDTGPIVQASEAYTYTRLNQVASVNGAQYTYDAADNLTRQLDGTIQAFDAASQICWSALSYAGAASCASKPSNAATFAYDADGERTQVAPPGQALQDRLRGAGPVLAKIAIPSAAAAKKIQSVTQVDIKYTYDIAHRLHSYGNPISGAYVYDGDGTRIEKWTSVAPASSARAPQSVGTSPLAKAAMRTTKTLPPAGFSYYTWSGSGSSARMIQEDTSAGTTEYVYGPGGMLLEQVKPSLAVSYYHADQIGSIRFITDSTGAVQATYTYDPYGNTTLAVANPGITNPFRFAGEYTDVESGLVYLRARYYEPNSGQFLTVDPLVAATHSPYDYVQDSPLNATDPSGECAWCIAAGVGFIVGAGSSIIVQYFIHHKKINWTDVMISGAAGATTFAAFSLLSVAAGVEGLSWGARAALLAIGGGSAGGSNTAQQWENNGHTFHGYSPGNAGIATGLGVAGSGLFQIIPGIGEIPGTGPQPEMVNGVLTNGSGGITVSNSILAIGSGVARGLIVPTGVDPALIAAARGDTGTIHGSGTRPLTPLPAPYSDGNPKNPYGVNPPLQIHGPQ